MHDEFYRELYDCFGLETCLRHSNLMDGPPQGKWNLYLITIL